ncbi:Methyltransferase family protein [Melia azedarach]|uniref:Methyltransferase family protein n=1 Tax=Melia azedarach TaxID=155640 RepID=A0ACC1Y7V1_MELAZ|nr:Methyltransferase family protein [Melia azedarach]
MTEPGFDTAAPPWLHLFSAFLAMEPTDSLASLAKVCGGGSVTERVQRFIWSYCISKAVGKGYVPYLKNFLKKLIVEVESNHGEVLDEIYERYTEIITSFKDDQRNVRVCKSVTFLFPKDCFDLPSCPESRKLMVPLQCSLNMLEGDTGCSIWPSSFYLSEFILSYPEIFSNKSCLEVGSGVGLVGICLAHVKASKVTLTDGDLSTLANMRSNLELNNLNVDGSLSEGFIEDQNAVQCIHLPWESASENDVHVFTPEIILGADIMYDPSCFPDLVRLLAIFLNPNSESSMPGSICVDKVNDPNQGKNGSSWEGPVAYIATVIRNVNTFNYFLALAEQANLSITDLTETRKPFNLLPYMQSYDRSSIRLITVSCKT